MSSFAEKLKMFNKAVNENQNTQKPKFVKQNFQKNEEKKTNINNSNQINNNQIQTNNLNNKKEENNNNLNNNNSNNNNNLNFGTSMKDRLKFFQQSEKSNEIKKTNINQFPKKLENKNENILNNNEKIKNIFEKKTENKIQNSNQNNIIQNNKPQNFGMSFQDRMKMFQNKKEEEKKIEPNIQKINKIQNQSIFEPKKKENITLEKPVINKNSNFQEKLKIMSQQQPSLKNNNNNNDFKPKLIQNNLKSNVEKMLEKNNNISDIKIEKEKFDDITEVYNEIKIVQNKKIPKKKLFFDDN